MIRTTCCNVAKVAFGIQMQCLPVSSHEIERMEQTKAYNKLE